MAIKLIEEKDIPLIIAKYDPDMQVPDYTADASKDGRYGYGLTGKFDMDVILKLLAGVSAKDIFEFGTWAGRTARILSFHLDHVYTLDMPREDAIKLGLEGRHQQWNEIPLRNEIGFASKELPNVTQFYGDSGLVDTIKEVRNGIGHQVDSCFIDADHSYKYVVCNTNQAMAMVKKGGLIIWHDVKDDGVVEVIPALELFDMNIYHVNNTWLGFAIND